MIFPCTSCGLCCTKIRETVRLAKLVISGNPRLGGSIAEIAAFPYAVKEDGSCVNLLPDHSCAVYATKPDICSVNRTWAKYHANISMVEYYRETAEMCNSFIVEAGFDDKFFIDPKTI